MLEEKTGRIILYAVIFFAAVIVISGIVGLLWLNSLFVLVLGAIISFLLVKDFPTVKVNKLVLLLSILLLAMLSYPVLLITPYFPAGADAIATTMVRVIDGRIPLDHAQYGPMNLSYQLGFALVTNVLSELVTIVPDYLWAWIIALAAGILQLFFVYLLSKEIFKSEKAAVFTSVLFFAGKLVYENMYNGEFPWLLATAFMFLFIYLYLKKSRLQYVVFPAIFATHPAVAFNLLVFMGTHFLFYKPKIKNVAKLLASLILVAPLIVMSYAPIIYNLLFNPSGTFESSASGFFSTVAAMPAWVGTGLSIIFFVLLVYSIIKKNVLASKEQKFFWSLLLVSIGLFIGFSFIGFMLAGRVIELVFISLLFLSTSFFMKLKINKKQFITVLIIVLVASGGFFLTSSRLNHYRSGSKISKAELEFSQALYSFDPEEKTVLFLTNYRGKIAEYSNKIPFDLNTAHIVLLRDFSYYPGGAFDEFKNKSRIRDSILYNKETNLIGGLNLDYIVVDEELFSEKLDYPVVFEYKNFKVYKKN